MLCLAVWEVVERAKFVREVGKNGHDGVGSFLYVEF